MGITTMKHPFENGLYMFIQIIDGDDWGMGHCCYTQSSPVIHNYYTIGGLTLLLPILWLLDPQWICQEKTYQFGERKKLRDQETACVALDALHGWKPWTIEIGDVPIKTSIHRGY